MTHTTEKGSPEPQEADTWVKVRRRKGRRPAEKTSAKGSSYESIPKDATISLEQVKQDHIKFSDEWKSSPAHGQLQVLLSGLTTITGSRITKAICFGLGTFDPPTWSWRRTSHIQLAAFLAIVEHLQAKANSQIRCIFQEPLFNSVDKAFITSLGHEVVESPDGFQIVDSDTMTFGIHLYKNVCLQILAACIPAIYIGTSHEAWDGLPTWHLLGGDSSRLKELDRLSASVKFPENKSDHVFASTSIYWRRSQDG